MKRWLGAGGRFLNLDYVRSIQVEKHGDLYNIMALTDSSKGGNELAWEIVATCTTEDQAFGYAVYLLGDRLINSEGGHPNLRRKIENSENIGIPGCTKSKEFNKKEDFDSDTDDNSDMDESLRISTALELIAKEGQIDTDE